MKKVDRSGGKYHQMIQNYSHLLKLKSTEFFFEGTVTMNVVVSLPCPTLCDPVDCGPPGSSVHGILQARILGWVAMPSSRGSSQLRDWTQVSRTGGQILYRMSKSSSLPSFYATFPKCSKPRNRNFKNTSLSCSFIQCVVLMNIDITPK